MKIYTSYFANWRHFPKDAVPIGITRFKPKSWNGINLVSLAPSDKLLRQYKNKYVDELMFKMMYYQELKERRLTPEFVRETLETAVGNKDVILCCYEKKGDFCHRHLLAEWLGGGEEL